MNNKTVIAEEVARAEVEAWLDFRKVRSSVREKYADSIDALVESVKEGLITLNNETYEWTQKLLIPIEGDKPFNRISLSA